MLEDLIIPPLSTILLYCVLGLSAMAEGPVASLAGGAASSKGLLLPVPAYLSVVLGNLTADMGWYAVGRFSKLEWLARFIRRFGVDPQRVESVTRQVREHAPRLIFFAKLSVGFPIPTLVATGLSRVPIRRWAGMLVLGELIKSAALVLVGYLYARAISQASQEVQIVLWSITGCIMVAGLVWYRRSKRKSSS